MARLVDETGVRYGRLVVRERALNHGTRAAWDCVCDCGGTAVVSGKDLRSGHTRSCGCLRVDTIREASLTHGQSQDPEYRVWATMLQRVGQRAYYKDVDVCERWLMFENFLADMGPRPEPNENGEHYSLDRIDPFGNYEPGNCRWATSKTQNLNQRRHHEPTPSD